MSAVFSTKNRPFPSCPKCLFQSEAKCANLKLRVFETREIACEQALPFGQAKRVSRERASEGPLARNVLARFVSLAQIGELARRLLGKWPIDPVHTPSFLYCHEPGRATRRVLSIKQKALYEGRIATSGFWTGSSIRD